MLITPLTALRQVRFSRRAMEDARPRHIRQDRRQRSESRVGWLFSYRGRAYDKPVFRAWGSILRDDHRGQLFCPNTEDVSYGGESLADVDDFALVGFNATNSAREP